MYILSEENEVGYTIPKELLERKIPAFTGIKARNNSLLLSYFANNGPSLPYAVFKNLENASYFNEKQYPTVYRRIKALVKEGYLTNAGTRPTQRGKQTEEIQYGLTTLGWVASLPIDPVRMYELSSLKMNLDTIVPEKKIIFGIEVNLRRLFPGFIELIERFYTKTELNLFFTSFLLGYLKSPAPSLDYFAETPIEFWVPWIKPIINNAAIEQNLVLPQGIDRTINLFELLDDPIIFEFVNQVLPIVKEYSENQIHTNMTSLLASTGLLDAFGKMKEGDAHSLVAENFVKNDFPNLLQQYRDFFTQNEVT